MIRIAWLLAFVFCIGVAPAAAQSDGVKESFKKTEKGFGNLLRGMGQELKKAGGTLTGGAKKGDKKGKEERK
jgi:hypothetical protein